MFTNANIPQAFQAVRDRDEKILWAGAPARLPFLASGVPFLLLGLVWGSIDYFGFIRNMKGIPLGFAIPFFALHLFPLWGSILNLLRLYLVVDNTYYAVTDRRIMMRSGFWGTDFKAVDFDQIANLEVNVNPLEHMLGVGSIRVYSGRITSKGTPIFDRLAAIANPYEVFKLIKQVSVDVKTDYSYPNAMRPPANPGYPTSYKPRS